MKIIYLVATISMLLNIIILITLASILLHCQYCTRSEWTTLIIMTAIFGSFIVCTPILTILYTILEKKGCVESLDQDSDQPFMGGINLLERIRSFFPN